MFGTALVALAVAAAAGPPRGSPHAWPQLGGALRYLLGMIVLTIVFHVPLNDQLAGLDPAAPASAVVWADHVARWARATPRAASGLWDWAL
jgi:uncharacterized membrane protein